MNKKIKIYAIVLAVVYVCMVASHLGELVEPFMGDLKAGREKIDLKNDDDSSEIFHVYVKPKSGAYSFPTVASTSEQQTTSVLEIDRVKVRQLISGSNTPNGYSVYFIIKVVITLLIFSCLVYIPFLFFKIVHAVAKGEIFGMSVVQRMMKIGWIIVAYFVVSLLFRVCDVYFAKQIIELADYKIVFAMPRFTMLILGVIILFLGEVLRASLTMKEEQDLTI